MTRQEHPLGMIQPTDDVHRRKYPLTADATPRMPTPVVLGVNWYSSFDDPEENRGGHNNVYHWIGTAANWGRVRGGHAICVKPPALKDLTAWWGFYDQGREGSCVGFAISRMMTLLNRTRYDGFRLYREAQRIDEWPGENYSGTSVRAGCDVARDTGLWHTRAGKTHDLPHAHEGISENRWATTPEEIAVCLSPDDGGRLVLDLGYVELLNSWGRDYPHKVRLPLESLDRLIREDGEASIVTDRR